MRYYAILIDGTVAYSSLASGGIGNGPTDPGALNVELDVPVISLATPMGFANLRVWGVALADISQAKDLVGKNIQVYAGMSQGLPLANPSQAGIIVQGYVFQAFGQWVGTAQYLEIVIAPGEGPNGTGTLVNPKNIVLKWKKGQPLDQAIKSALSTAFPGFTINANISSALTRQNGEQTFYPTVPQLAQYVKQASRAINKDVDYAGVDIVLTEKTFNVYDGTGEAGTVKKISYIDLIGQPTWIESPLITWKCAMRADLKLGDKITLPETQITNSQQAQSSLVNQKLTFQGGFTINMVRHVGNFRQATAEAWVTVFQAYAKPVKGVGSGFL